MTALAVSVDWTHIFGIAALYCIALPLAFVVLAVVLMASDRRADRREAVQQAPAPLVDLSDRRTRRGRSAA